jgi:hypothetical protein
MSTSSNTAARLIEYAPAPAVDLLFAKIGNESIRFRTAPSSHLVRERWSTVSADLAISLIGAITDPELLDFIAAKEKRKTVRSALVSNRHLHPVTRLYFLQEGLRARDWDLLHTVMGNMAASDQIEYISEDDTLNRYIRNRNLGKALIEMKSDEELVRSLQTVDATRFNLVETMLAEDVDRAFRCFEAAGLSIEGHQLNRCPNGATNEQIRTLIATSRSRAEFMTTVASELPIQRLIEIDPTLLDRLASARCDLTPENAELLISHGRLDVVLELVRQHRLDEDTAEILAAAVSDVADRLKISMVHPNDEHAAALVNDPAAFGAAATEISSRDFLRWVLRVAPFIGVDATVTLIDARRGDLDIDGSTFGKLLDIFGLSSDEFFDKLPDELLGHLSGFRALENPAKLLERVISLPAGVALNIALGLSAPFRRDLATELLSAKIIFAHGEDAHKGAWLESATRPALEAVLDEHGTMLTSLVMRYRRVTMREEWADLLMPLMAPKGGWGAVNGSEMMKLAMATLASEIGDDTHLWETVLGLFHDWSGTLPELVSAARAL